MMVFLAHTHAENICVSREVLKMFLVHTIEGRCMREASRRGILIHLGRRAPCHFKGNIHTHLYLYTLREKDQPICINSTIRKGRKVMFLLC